MNKHTLWQAIAQKIEQMLQKPINITSIKALSGGDINQAYTLTTKRDAYFIKLNQRDLLPMFEAEFLGLNALIDTHTVRAPKPLATDAFEDHAFIIMENMALFPSTSSSDRLFGEQLAQLHQHQPPFFGWPIDNTIGSTTQINTQSNDWVRFWQKNRLAFQLALAKKKGYGGQVLELGERLVESVPLFFNNYTPSPALLHGDLWGGNVARTQDGQPVIYDPACYYGDREADIAMTELFGGFSDNFYAAYHNTYPLDEGYSTRKNLYNLYHILNHLNLFGEGYRHQAQMIMVALLSELN